MASTRVSPARTRSHSSTAAPPCTTTAAPPPQRSRPDLKGAGDAPTPRRAELEPATAATQLPASASGSSLPAPGQGSRLAALDGLRGIAALVVVLHHTAMTSPAISAALMRPRDNHPEPGSATWLLTRTPAYLAIGGHEAVFVFFVLSGLVLTLPRLKASPEPWRAYYPKRLVRLYVPVIASVLFAGVLFRLVPRALGPDDGIWLQHAALAYPPTHMLRDMVLLAFISGAVSPLWSLTYEMWFSILLPLYVWAATRWPRAPWTLLVAALLALAGATAIGPDSPLFRLQYLVTFALGVALAVRLELARGWVLRLWGSTGGRSLLAGLLVVALCLASLRGLLVGAGVDIVLAQRLDVFDVLGCALLLVLATMTPLGQRLLESRLAQWLGVVSFSLYLVHEPVVIAAHQLTGGRGPWLTGLVAIPLSLLLAMVFQRAVEAPSHRLARRVGRRFG